MVTYDELEKVVIDSGLWISGQDNYRFILSPSVYELTRDQSDEFQILGAAIYDVLAGLARIKATTLNQSLFLGGGSWGMLSKALEVGIPKYYHSLAAVKPSRTPSVLKVDLLEGTDGRFYIAEIDGHNKHGFGYSTLAARMRDLIKPNANVFPGVAKKIAAGVKNMNPERENLLLLYADQERFYLPEFNILAETLAEYGIETVVIAESDVKNERLLADQQLLVDLPFMYHNKTLIKSLTEAYQKRGVDFLIPPKPFLGSKAVLALIRNDEGNEQLESILRSQIPGYLLELVRQYIPKTYLVGHLGKNLNVGVGYGNLNLVLKETISSGMKGTIFEDDPEFEAVFKRARNSRYQFVLQEEISTVARQFLYFNDDEELAEDNWYTRVTVHYSQRTVADVVVTARRDKRVHGAPDCLQLGTVII